MSITKNVKMNEYTNDRIQQVIPSFHHSIIPSFHHSIIPSFNHSITQLFSHSIIPSFNYSIIQLFSHSIIPSFNYSIIQLFSHSLILSFLLIFLSSCQKGYFTPPVQDPNTPISFTTDLQPILTTQCAGSGCHNGTQSPNLITGNAYTALMDGGFVDTLNPSQSILMLKLNSNMPPGKLPAAEINKFLFWMQQGAKDN